MLTGSSLPPLYTAWLAELIAGGLPDEPMATCASCPMCERDDRRVADEVLFDPRTKCCTYLPSVPNFLVGRALLDRDPAAASGRDTVLARIAQGVAVTPLGLGVSPAFTALYDLGGPAVFGKARTLRCPHYLESPDGNCGIWRHRNAVCATWFCKHDRGATGDRLWAAVRRLLTTIEHGLAWWCLLELDLDPEVLRRLVPARAASSRKLAPHELDGEPDPDRARAWGRWLGRERELYEACAERVAALSWDDVRRVGGAEVALHARLVAASDEALRADLPPRVRPASYRVVVAGRDTVRLRTYSPYDPVELPRELLDVLPLFEGVTVEQALARIEDDAQLALEPDLVRRLVDFEVLVPDPRPPG